MLMAAAGRLHPKVSWFCKVQPQVHTLGFDVSGALGNRGVTVAFEALTCVQPPTVGGREGVLCEYRAGRDEFCSCAKSPFLYVVSKLSLVHR